MSDDPDLKKLSDRKLADLFGVADKQAKAAAKHVDKIKKEFVRRGKSRYLGADYDVVRVTGEQQRFDSDAVKLEMGDDWYDARKHPVPTTSWVVSAKAVAPVAEVA